MSSKVRKVKTNNSSNNEMPMDCKDVLALVSLKETNGGFTYLDFTLHRVHQSKHKGKIRLPQRFLARNRGSLHKAIDEACDFIERHQAHPELAIQEVQKEHTKHSANAVGNKDAVKPTELIVRDAA